MRKKDLVQKISKITGVSGRKVSLIINAFLEEISQALERGERVELRGFGVFKVTTRREKEMFQPRTGERITLPSHLFPYFKPGKKLKERVKE
ncbi:MAG TPA: integration host factor subunit beta [bacterium]|nr:integration host factor subunit beta [bacterium]HEX68065.1 integration host factor subunit beta [bacterium]